MSQRRAAHLEALGRMRRIMFKITAKTTSISLRLSAALLLIDGVAIEAVSAQNAPAPFEFVWFDPSATAISPVFSPDGSQLIFS